MTVIIMHLVETVLVEYFRTEDAKDEDKFFLYPS